MYVWLAECVTCVCMYGWLSACLAGLCMYVWQAYACMAGRVRVWLAIGLPTLMFHPRGPNFLRSRMMAWKKQMPKMIRRQSMPRAATRETTAQLTIHDAAAAAGLPFCTQPHTHGHLSTTATEWMQTERMTAFLGRTKNIIGGSCHKYHVCRDKHVFVTTLSALISYKAIF